MSTAKSRQAAEQQPILIPLKDIDTTDRLREVDSTGVEKLVASIQVGLQRRLLSPISVREIIPTKYKLITGAHRIAAAFQLKWDDIPAVVIECTESEARMLEIDENLHRAELSPYDQAEFLTMRWRLWLQKSNRHKPIQNVLDLSDGVENAKFYSETAGLAGVDPETIRLAVRRRRYLDDVWPLLKRTDAASNGILLDRLRKKFPYSALEIVETALRDFDGSLEKAMDAAAAADKAGREPKISISADVAFRNLRKAWKNCPSNKRRKFVLENSEEISGLLEFNGAEK